MGRKYSALTAVLSIALLLLISGIVKGGGGGTPGASHLNCSTSESTIQSAATTILCDDFELSRNLSNVIASGKTVNAGYNVGTYAVSNGDNPVPAGEEYPPNKGWGIVSPGSSSVFAFGSTACGGTGNTPGGSVQGANGTNCTATFNPPGTNNGAHNFPGTCISPFTTLNTNCFNNSSTGVKEYNEAYFRFMIRLRTGFAFGSDGNQKFITIDPGTGPSGILIGNLGAAGGDGRLPFCPTMDCNYASNVGYVNPQNPANCGNADAYLCQNAGNGVININSPQNRWYAIEIHIIRNTGNNRNGTLQIWADDCGTAGTTCPATPTLRSNYTNVGFTGQSSVFCNICNPPLDTTNTRIGSFWMDTDTCCAGSSTGTIDIDQVVVSTQRIGWMGTSAPTPPTAPSNLRIVLDGLFARLRGLI